MYTFVLVCHVLIAITLVGVVLVQSGKGGGLGAGFGGGGANTLFGSSGGGNFFTKLTMALAFCFMCTSLGLTMMKSHTLKTSIFDQGGAASKTQQTMPVATPGNGAGQSAPDKATKGALEPGSAIPANPAAPAKP
jgi:preprotein translocase subunit SecG